MKFFDCNCYFGEMAKPPLRYARNMQGLISEMDFCGIGNALVYHSSMRFGSPVSANIQLAKELKDNIRLASSWTLLPQQTGEFPESNLLLKLMKDYNVRALRAFPNEHRYSLDARTFGGLFEVMVAKKIPLFVRADILSIGRLLAEFPDLIVIAMQQGPHSLERYLRPLIETYQNLYIETSAYIIDGAIEEFCSLYGAERLLFGSGFPDNCSGGALLTLSNAEIRPTDKEAIACNNLERLLEDVFL